MEHIFESFEKQYNRAMETRSATVAGPAPPFEFHTEPCRPLTENTPAPVTEGGWGPYGAPTPEQVPVLEGPGSEQPTEDLPDFPFEFVVQADDGSVLFAGPLPPPYGEGLYYELDEDGHVHMSEEDFYLWEDAWEWFSVDLRTGSLLPDGLDEAGRTDGRTLRTRRQAEQAGAITSMPKTLAIPTLPPYQNAMMPIKNPTAYLQPITEALAHGLMYKDGVLYFNGQPAVGFDLTKFYDHDRKAVSGLDLPTLWALYSIVLKEIEPIAKDPEKAAALAKDRQFLGHHFDLYVPKFLEMLGYTPRGRGQADVAFAIAKVSSYEHLLGIIKEWGFREFNSPYPVVTFMGYDDKTNCIHVSCPYLNILVQTIIKTSIKTDKKGEPKLKRNGKPMMKPANSYLIKRGICKERNVRAVIIVGIVVTLIEQAGSPRKGRTDPEWDDPSVPSISARTIIERCPDLKEALDTAKTSSDKNKILKRAFSKAWELLRTHTYLTKAYKEIKLPTTIPTASNLDMVFEFPHKGKIKGKITDITDEGPKKKRLSPKPKQDG